MFRTHHVVQPADVVLEHLLVQKEDGASGLTVRRGRYLACHGQMGQELVHFLHAHVTGMALAMKQDKALDPTQGGCFGA